MYYRAVDKRSRRAMTTFLRDHFRYHTMNSWNQSTSYANCIKLHHVTKPSNIDDDTWWQMLEIPEWHEMLGDLLDDFGNNHNWTWPAGINGRIGGYVVLYQGGIKASGYKSYCTRCGQKNYQAISEGQVGICGRCHVSARVNFTRTHMQVFTRPGKSVDLDEDFQEWSMTELQARVELVQGFDNLCDDIVSSYIGLCGNFRITEEEILIPKTDKVLEPVV